MRALLILAAFTSAGYADWLDEPRPPTKAAPKAAAVRTVFSQGVWWNIAADGSRSFCRECNAGLSCPTCGNGCECGQGCQCNEREWAAGCTAAPRQLRQVYYAAPPMLYAPSYGTIYGSPYGFAGGGSCSPSGS